MEGTAKVPPPIEGAIERPHSMEDLEDSHSIEGAVLENSRHSMEGAVLEDSHSMEVVEDSPTMGGEPKETQPQASEMLMGIAETSQMVIQMETGENNGEVQPSEMEIKTSTEGNNETGTVMIQNNEELTPESKGFSGEDNTNLTDQSQENNTNQDTGGMNNPDEGVIQDNGTNEDKTAEPEKKTGDGDGIANKSLAISGQPENLDEKKELDATASVIEGGGPGYALLVESESGKNSWLPPTYDKKIKNKGSSGTYSSSYTYTRKSKSRKSKSRKSKRTSKSRSGKSKKKSQVAKKALPNQAENSGMGQMGNTGMGMPSMMGGGMTNPMMGGMGMMNPMMGGMGMMNPMMGGMGMMNPMMSGGGGGGGMGMSQMMMPMIMFMMMMKMNQCQSSCQQPPQPPPCYYPPPPPPYCYDDYYNH